MIISLKRLYRFLAKQGFYPLVLSTLLALFLFALRAVFARTLNYSALVWNLFLAWIPYVCSAAAYGLYLLYPKRWWYLVAPAALWLIFFPNAPYILTDFLHLQRRPPIPLWYDIGVLTAFSLSGLFLAILSLRTMQFLIQKHLGKAASWFFALLALLLSGLGIYIGRIGRWNSWDLIFNPLQVLRYTFDRVTSFDTLLQLIAFTGLFTGILLVSYLMVVWISSLEPRERAQPD